jgi:hypothetical protein
VSCPACGRGFHEECVRGCERCHPKSKESVLIVESERLHGTTAENLRDPKSTGRKRAAILYPLDKNAECEWRGKKNCGGGKRPVIGCVEGKQTHRHHGPVKDTTRNNEGNVHRICSRCHNHWHELNDLVYDAKEFGLLPHDPEPADIKEVVQNHMDWVNGVIARKYELASTKNRLDTRHG